MTKHIEADSSKLSLLLTILFTILSCVLWTIVILFILKIPALTWAQEKIQIVLNRAPQVQTLDNDTAIVETQTATKTVDVVETPIADQQGYLEEITLDTISKYDYPLFFYPVSQSTRLPMDFPTTKAQIPLVKIGEVSVAEIIASPLTDLMEAAKEAGLSPYLRSGFRSIDDQYTAYSKYVTEATASGKNLKEAREYANRFSAQPGYSEHHLGLAVDLLDYYYPDWIIARTNYDKGLYLWLRQHAHKFGFVLSYPTGTEKLLAKPGSGYSLSEPWHLRFVGKDLAMWLFNNGYLDPQIDITVFEILRDINKIVDDSIPAQQ
ncbi:MAG: M15 family metallopeptidase [Anaerolineaceae bacterium]